MKTVRKGGSTWEEPLKEILGNLCFGSQCNRKLMEGYNSLEDMVKMMNKGNKKRKEMTLEIVAYEHNLPENIYYTIYLKISKLYLSNREGKMVMPMWVGNSVYKTQIR